MKMKIVTYIIAMMIMVTSALGAVTETNNFFDQNGAVTDVNSLVYDCTDNNCFEGTNRIYQNSGATNEIVINFPTTSQIKYWAEYFYKDGYMPKMFSTWYWGTMAVQYDNIFQKADNVIAEVKEIKALNNLDLSPQHFEVTVGPSLDIYKPYSTEPYFMPEELKQDHLSTDISLRFRVYKNRIQYDEQIKPLNLFLGSERKAVFMYTPNETGEYTVEVTSLIADNQAATQIDNKATKTFTIGNKCINSFRLNSANYEVGDTISLTTDFTGTRTFRVTDPDGTSWLQSTNTVVASKEGNYKFELSCGEQANLTAYVKPRATYTVDIEVFNDQDLPVQGAQVLLDGQSLITDSNGMVTYTNQLPGDKKLIIRAAGYMRFVDDLELGNDNVYYSASLHYYNTDKKNIMFNVKDRNGNPVVAATVLMEADGQALEYTDGAGDAPFNEVTHANYFVEINKPGYEQYRGRLVVTGAQTVNIVMQPQDTPVFTPVPTQNIQENQQLTFNVAATDTHRMQYTPVSMPEGAAFVNQQFTWTPGFDFVSGEQGHRTIQAVFKATDEFFNEGTVTVSITVTNTNRQPTITSTATTITTAEALYQYDVEAHDLDGDNLSYYLNTAPAGMTIDQSTGLVEWTPTNAEVGTHLVIVNVSDSYGGNIIQNYNLVVLGVPVINIVQPADNGNKTEKYNVTFEAAATDAEDGDISYKVDWYSSIDGHFATEALFNYSALSVGVHTITANVTDTDGNTRQDQITFTILANNAPVVTIMQPADLGNETEKYNVTFQATALDQEEGDLSSQIQWYSNIDGLFGTGAMFNYTALSVGTHTITANVTDWHGAPGQDQITFTILANNAPFIEILQPANNSNQTEQWNVTFEANAYDQEDGNLNASIQWFSDIDNLFGTGNLFNYSALSVGTHRITAQVTDWHGQTRYDIITFTVLANNAPVVTITSPPDSSSHIEQRNITFSGYADDQEDGIIPSERLSWYSSVDGYLGNGTDFNLSTLSIGTHTITLNTTDSHNEVGQASVTINVNANTAPTVVITDPDDNDQFQNNTMINFRATADDDEDGALNGNDVVWTSNLDGNFGNSTSVDYNALSVGLHTIRCTATDSHGAVGYDQITINITPTPNQPPTIQIIQPNEGHQAVQYTNVTFEATATDPEEGAITDIRWVSDIDNNFQNGTLFNYSQLSVGYHTITATAYDSNGATDSAVVHVNITADNAPIVNIVAPSDNSNHLDATMILFNATADDEDGDLSSSLNWYSDVDGYLGHGATFSLDTLSLGTHLITANVTDSHNQLGQDTVTIHVITDSNPFVTIQLPNENDVYNVNQNITFRVAATDLEDGDLSDNVTWYSNIDGYLGRGREFNRTLSIGQHTVTANVTDQDHNIGQDVVHFNVTDLYAPVVTITMPNDGASFLVGTNITFRATAIDQEQGDISSRLEWYSDIDNYLGTGAEINYTLSQGTHTIVALAVDDDGLQGSDNITVYVTGPGPSAPACSFNYAPTNPDVDETVTFTSTSTDADDDIVSWQWSFGASGEQAQHSWDTAGNYTVTLTVRDSTDLQSQCSQNVEVAPTGCQVLTRQIHLNKGWNLVSFDVQPSSTQIELVLASIQGQYDIVQAYKDGHALEYDPSIPSFSNLRTMEPEYGYWIKAKNDITLSIEGLELCGTETISLNQNWNLISYYPNTAMDVAAALSSIDGQYELVQGYKNGHALEYDPSIPSFSNLKQLEPGFGYWIKMKQSASLVWG